MISKYPTPAAPRQLALSAKRRYCSLFLVTLLLVATLLVGTVFAINVKVTVIIEHVKDIGDLEFGGESDFYAVVSIDGNEQDNRDNAWSNDDSIDPHWSFAWEPIDINRGSIPVWIQIWDKDGFLRFDDDKGDISGVGEDMDLSVTLSPCSISGDISGACDTPITSEGGGGDAVRIRFRIEIGEPATAPGLNVLCIHSPIWPQVGDMVTINATALDGDLQPTVIADSIRIYVNDRTTPAITGTGSNLLITVGPFDGTDMFYKCRVQEGDDDISTDFVHVAVGSPDDGLVIPILYHGYRSSALDFVFFPGQGYSGSSDPVFLSDVSNVILNAYWNETVYLKNQTRMNFWLAHTPAVAESSTDGCDHGVRTDLLTWIMFYSFMDSGPLLHRTPDQDGDGDVDTDDFRDCAPGGGRIFSTNMLSTGWNPLDIVLHETGHRPFGLADEYCCDGGYYENRPHPNLYQWWLDCAIDLPAGKTVDDCRSFDEDVKWWFDESWFTSDPSSNDLMVDIGQMQVLDSERIAWVFRECAAASCEVLNHPDILDSSPSSRDNNPGVAETTRDASIASYSLPGGDLISSVQSTLGPIPTPIPRIVPRTDYEKPKKSIFLQLNFASRTNVSLDYAIVSPQPGPANIGNPPLLGVEIYSKEGALVADFNYWHPLWLRTYGNDGRDSLTILPNAIGELILPFDPSWGQMRLRDIALNQELIQVDLRPAIRSFCEQNPSDVDCFPEVAVSKFYGRPGENLLPTDAERNPEVDVILAGGHVRSTNPGNIEAWIRATNTGVMTIRSLQLSEILPIDWTVHPEWLPARGGIHVLFEYADGKRVEITRFSTITVVDGNPGTIVLSIPDLSATAVEKALDPGESILIGAKLDYSLSGSAQSASSYPRRYNDTATATAWIGTDYAGKSTLNSASMFFTARARIAGASSNNATDSILDGQVRTELTEATSEIHCRPSWN